LAATRCVILRIRCTKFNFGFVSDPGGNLTALPRPTSWNGKGRGRKGVEKENGGGEERRGGREREGREGEPCPERTDMRSSLG